MCAVSREQLCQKHFAPVLISQEAGATLFCVAELRSNIPYKCMVVNPHSATMDLGQSLAILTGGPE